MTPRLQLVAWELTRRCNLFCEHCRASSTDECYQNELSTEEGFKLIDQILEVGKPILILSGGEPLMRRDVCEIARYATDKGLRVVMGSNGTLIDDGMARGLKESGVMRIGISLDFPTPELQDSFRGKKGAFAAVMAGIESARRAGLEIQINSTVTRLNMSYLDKILDIALDVSAAAFHPFMLVPTGRGKGLETVELSPQQYEETLNWIYDRQQELGNRIFFKPTDAPHYMRILKQRQKENPTPPVHGGQPGGHGHFGGGRPGPNTITRGCLAGTGFCFISHRGKVQGCGYLTAEAGDIREKTFHEVWYESPLFNTLRNLDNLKGKCGRCEYKRICGGCRARAYEATGDCLEAEPYCIYQPRRQEDNHGTA
ncbi:MAG: radical SAM protein [Dehalococcoidia bacterium]|nr:radical SAM protein [Dehalococcoidia bacterium]